MADNVKLEKEHGVEKIAFEAFSNQFVYNPSTLLELREAIGIIRKIKIDPSRFFVLRIEPIASIRKLKGEVYYVHGKDVLKKV